MESSKKLNDLVNSAFLSFHSTLALLTRLEERTYQNEAGISFPQFLVLATVVSAGPPVTQTLIARTIHRGLNSVSMIIDRMERQGLVVRTRSEDDRRESHITVTEHGMNCLNKALTVGGALRQRIGKAFSPEELEESLRFMTTLKKEIVRELGEGIIYAPDDPETTKQMVDIYRRRMEEAGEADPDPNS